MDEDKLESLATSLAQMNGKLDAIIETLRGNGFDDFAFQNEALGYLGMANGLVEGNGDHLKRIDDRLDRIDDYLQGIDETLHGVEE